MAEPPINLRVEESASFKRLFARSSQVDKVLRTALRRNIRRAAGQAANAAKAEARRPGRSTGRTVRSTGLRGRIAAGIQVKVMTGNRAGVTIVASASAMAAKEKTLVRAWEKAGGWRHPVYGGPTWVTQQGRPFFRSTIFEQREQVRAAVEDAMTEAAQSLTRG